MQGKFIKFHNNYRFYLITPYSNFKLKLMYRYQNEFGFILSGRKIYVDDIRVRGIGKTMLNIENEGFECKEPPQIESVSIFAN